MTPEQQAALQTLAESLTRLERAKRLKRETDAVVELRRLRNLWNAATREIERNEAGAHA